MPSSFRCAFVCLCLAFSTAFTQAQAVQKDRIGVHPDLRAKTALQGHVPRWVESAKDRGEVPASMPLRLTFALSRSSEAQASFTQLLADQQNPASLQYHRWLTPQQIGDQYGPTQHDIDSLTDWLSAQGFTGVEISPSRVFVSATATASNATAALGTNFHYFDDNGESRLSATVEPSIPTAFASVVNSIFGLSDGAIRPMHRAESRSEPGQPGVQPHYTNSNNGSHYITPGDFSTIFDLKPIYNAGYTGVGQKIAIIGRSRIASTDITQFGTKTGLASKLPNTIIPSNGVDPGITGDGDQSEATLDVERALGTAPGAQIDLVVSGSAGGYNGIYVAAQYEVQTLLDPVMNISFGACEQYAGPAQVGLWDSLFAQAAGEGISVFVSAMDSGAAGCDAQFSAAPAYQSRSINYICSSSYATCVGGTQFADTSNPSQYWSATNGSDRSSALSYIPEGAWNEPVLNGQYVVASGGGGASLYVAKPAWQTGVGVPADNARDVPDVSFPSASHDGYFGCFALGGGDCASNYYESFSGTSAASPAMAGVAAILNQKLGGSQGNINPLLYRIAASSPNALHDATPASSGVTGCSISTPSPCNNSTPGTSFLTGGLAGYALTTGYDQATGLGSLDVANFVNAAAVPATALASTTLTVKTSASTISNTQTATFTATLSSATAGNPTGTIQFYADGSAIGSPVSVVSGTAVSAELPFPAAGSYYISATYSGDSAYASSMAPGIPLTVTGKTSVTQVSASSVSIPTGTSATFSVTIAGGSGSVVPTGTVRFFSTYGGGGYIATVPLVGGTATTPAIPFLTVGNYTLTALYAGDSVYSPSNSTLSFAVQKQVSGAQLSATSSSIGVGGSKSYGVSVYGFVSSTAPSPTGTIQLYANGVALGSPFAPSGSYAPKESPLEMFSAAGTYTITAVYSGDAYWQPSTATGLSQIVLATPASYQMSTGSSNISIKAGATSGNTSLVTVAGQLGFAGSVGLQCAIAYNGSGTATSMPTCTLSTSSVTVVPDLAPLSSQITILTTGSTVTANGFDGHGNLKSDQGWLGTAGVTLCVLVLWWPPRRRKTWNALAGLAVLAGALTVLSGCGGGGNSTPAPPVAPPAATTPGSYTVTITATPLATGSATPSTITINLTVS